MEVVVKAGANPDTVEVTVEIDSQKNILRAVATGATEMRTKDLNVRTKNLEELNAVVRESAAGETCEIDYLAHAGRWHVFQINESRKRFMGLWKSKKSSIRVVDEEGVIRLQKNRAKVLSFHKKELGTLFPEFIDSVTTYTDAGAGIPKTYLYFNQKSVDLSGVMSREQLLALADMECEYVDDNTEIVAVAANE